MQAGFAEFNGKMLGGFAEFNGRMLGGFATVDGKFAEFEKKMLAGFAEIRVGRVWDRVWMLMIAAGLLGIIARVFKWI
jgi:hypothetical protein